jgi:UTP-glucose-1-phosphate uridylyltransferase
MGGGDVTQVVVAAGGLGTRVAGWARIVPKEFAPHQGLPGIVHLLAEISALAPARVVIVYHPYYEAFYTWARKILTPRGLARYDRAAGRPTPDTPVLDGLDLVFVRQHGRYADVTSVLNAAAVLRRAPLHLVFADNLYPGHHLPGGLGQAGTPGVLARPFCLDEAVRRGVIICAGDGLQMRALVEKPTRAQAQDLADEHGPQNLRLLEGRAWLTPAFIDHLKISTFTVRIGEAKLSLALAGYARDHQVDVVTTTSDVIDLGAPSPVRASTSTLT